MPLFRGIVKEKVGYRLEDPVSVFTELILRRFCLVTADTTLRFETVSVKVRSTKSQFKLILQRSDD